MDVIYEVRNGTRMATLPADDFERLVGLAEERADARAAHAAEQRRGAGEEYVPASVVDRILAGESPLRVWRRHRGLTLARLGSFAGIRQSYLSEIESGKKPGSPGVWRKLANALGVDLDDIMPDA